MAVVKPSSKYQIVIPRKIREQLGIEPGKPLYIDMATGGKEARISTMSVIDRYAGNLKGAWGDEDPAVWLRRDRDSWDK